MHKNITNIYESLKNSAFVITPNNRLSQQIIEDFANLEITNQAQVSIDKPECLPYQLFLKKLYANICEKFPDNNHPILLTKLQEKFLWQRTLKIDTQDGFLQEIYDAWIRCTNWQINLNDELFNYNDQTIFFKNICLEFKTQLKKLNAITEEQIVNYIQPFLMQDKTFAKTKMIWMCFDNYTPVQIKLQDILKKTQSLQLHFDLPDIASEPKKYEALDNKEEIVQIINWLKKRLELGDKRIGVVVPGLQEQSQSLQRQIQNEIGKEKFNISLGKSLLQFPLIAHAIAFLNFNNQIISHDLLRLIINSPYLGFSKEEFLIRNRLIAQHEILQEPFISLKNLQKILKKHSPKLSELITNITPYPKSASVYEWSLLFKRRLKNLDFPGEYPLNTLTYQCFQRLLNLFDEFLQIGLIQPVLTQNEALSIIHELANLTIFQLQKSNCEIQILGMLEASGCSFDSLWIGGLTNQCLPQKTKLSPFIPATIQKTYKMPHALPERELKLAEQTLKRLYNATNEQCIVSYPKLIGELTNMPSPLIANLSIYNAEKIHDEPTNNLEVYFDDYKLPVLENEKIKGGTQILANQAKCPFRAFAIHRLQAKEPYKIQEGINALSRGKIIHRILELFFKDIPNQQALINLTNDDINKKISASIEDALTPWIQNESYLLPKVMREVEFKRLTNLLKEAINWEKERRAFNIKSLEETFNVEIGKLKIKVRVDRIDLIYDENGHATQMVIDYKTKLPQKKPWLDDRPEEPQLLLYALLDKEIKTLSLVELNKGQITCSGLSENDLDIKGIKKIPKEKNWQDYQKQWQEVLNNLAQEFIAGICTPTPKREEICSNCWVRGICRIDSC